MINLLGGPQIPTEVYDDFIEKTEHPLVQQDAGTIAILLLLWYAIAVDMLFQASAQFSVSFVMPIFALVWQNSTDFQNWALTNQAASVAYLTRNAKIGTWVIRRIWLNSDSSYDLWSDANIPSMLYIYWAIQWPLAVIGTLMLSIPVVSSLWSLSSSLIVSFLY